MSSFDNRQWQFEQGADLTDNDPGPGITDDLKCPGCGYQFDIETMDSLFTVEESGVSDGTPDGPPVYWAQGYVTCPQCQAELPYEEVSN